MKKRIYFFLVLLFLTGLCSSCTFLELLIDNSQYTNEESNKNTTTIDSKDDYTVPNPGNSDGYVVTFHCNNGYTYTTNSNSNNKILKPDNPTKLCAEFLYWSTNISGTTEFNFDKTISSNLDLYAIYDINFAELTNYISMNTIKANVRIECEFYNIAIYGSTSASSLGSGVIIDEDDSYYYCLTNNHVTYKPNEYKYSKYIVEDCYEEEYEAELIKGLNTYDLALLRFKKKKNSNLKCINISNTIPNKNEYIVSLGEPLGQSNCITYGKIINTSATFIPLQDSLDSSNVTFNVISHDAVIASGSSGGALLDTNLNLIGINFASSINSNTQEYINAFSIPIDKVKEFLA
ncbi:MAG: S1C family serine protease [Anaeroplasma sp.]